MLKQLLPVLCAALSYGKLSYVSGGHAGPGKGARGVGPTVAWSLFYVTGLMVGGGLFGWCCVAQRSGRFVLALFVVHAGRRLGETLFVHRHSGGYSVSALQCVAGVSFYVATPLALFLDGYPDRRQGPASLYQGSKFIVSSGHIAMLHDHEIALKTYAENRC